MSPDLVVLGNLIVDDIVYEDGSRRQRQPGGAVLYMGLTANLWGLSLGIVSVAGRDFPAAVLRSLSRLGVDLAGVRRVDRNGLRTCLYYADGSRRVEHQPNGASHMDASPVVDDIPTGWHPRAIHLAPMPFDLQRRQLTDLRQRFGTEILLSLDPFERFGEGCLEVWRDLIEPLDLLLFSEDEMASSTARRDPETLLRQLLHRRQATILYKQGDRGGIACRQQGRAMMRWPARADRVVDVTGAGDAFACGVLAGLLDGSPLDHAIEQGIVSASFAIEGQGTEGLLAATPAAAELRLATWFESRKTTPRGGARSARRP